MRILMLLSNPFTHDPRVYNEARSLFNAGHEVTVIAWDRNKQYPLEEEKDGIAISRFRNTKFMDILPYDFLRLRFWWNNGFKMALKLHKKEPFDAIHCHDLDTLPIGVHLKAKTGLPLIYDVHEMWGYMVEKDFPKFIVEHFMRKEKRLISKVDRVITVSAPPKKYLQRITDKSITLVMNCKTIKETDYEPPNNDRFTVIYIGTLANSRFLLELVDVVGKLENVHCIIGGMGKPEYANKIKTKCSEVENSDFIGRISLDEVIPMTKKADLIFCMLDPNDRNSREGLPNKMFEAMVCGRPVIVTKNLCSDVFIEKNKCGIASEYNKTSLKKAILKLKGQPELCRELGENALRAALDVYNWEKQAEKLSKVYEGLETNG